MQLIAQVRQAIQMQITVQNTDRNLSKQTHIHTQNHTLIQIDKAITELHTKSRLTDGD
jgi:hypothetical protein